mgnify:CR=1 FL=1
MDLYNLYIIAADMEQENTGSHTFNFDQYFQGQHAQEAKTFAWSLDAEDFYEKGPGRAGQDETYRIAQPLLDDFFNAIDTRERAGTAATFRFAHAETIIPFAALLKLPGSQQQASELYTYENNPWRGESVTPMAANVQWDVVVRDGTDVSGQPYQPLVRMLYNEKEIGFNDSCTPIADGSTWYKESELKSCLNGKGTTVDARLTDEEGQPETPGHESTPDDSQKAPGANDANGQRKHPVKSSANGGDAVKLAKPVQTCARHRGDRRDGVLRDFWRKLRAAFPPEGLFETLSRPGYGLTCNLAAAGLRSSVLHLMRCSQFPSSGLEAAHHCVKVRYEVSAYAAGAFRVLWR